MADDQGERTEEATEQRREDFKKRGQVPMTRELSTAVFFLAAAGMMYMASRYFLQNVVELFSRTMAVIGQRAKTAVTRRTGISADGQRQSINALARVGGLPAYLHQVQLQPILPLPEISCLPHKSGTARQSGEEVAVMSGEILIDVLVMIELKVFAADFNGNHLGIGKSGGKATAAM